MRLVLLSTALVFASTAAHAAGAPDKAPIYGFYADETRSIIEIYPCTPGTETVCARLEKVTADSPVTVDRNNPDASLKTRSLCGLIIGEGFTLKDPTHAEGGHLYDPKTGKTYKGSITSEGDKLKLRGYVGAKLFGRTAEWTRTTAPGSCSR